MIPIKEAINSGAWLHCEIVFSNGTNMFRLRIISFRKLKLSEVDEPDKIKEIDSNTSYWIMDIEVINLTKEPISTSDSTDLIILIDQEGFQFPVFGDGHLRCSSKFAEKSLLKRFYGMNLIPKIKAVGAIPFQLPDDDDAVYSISLKKGTISEA
jgi:hypothetical protein